MWSYHPFLLRASLPRSRDPRSGRPLMAAVQSAFLRGRPVASGGASWESTVPRTMCLARLAASSRTRIRVAFEENSHMRPHASVVRAAHRLRNTSVRTVYEDRDVDSVARLLQVLPRWPRAHVRHFG